MDAVELNRLAGMVEAAQKIAGLAGLDEQVVSQLASTVGVHMGLAEYGYQVLLRDMIGGRTALPEFLFRLGREAGAAERNGQAGG